MSDVTAYYISVAFVAALLVFWITSAIMTGSI